MGNDQFDLSGKVAIVVRATKGMGAAIAEQFVASGARVTVNSRSAAEADAFAGRLNDRDERGKPVARAAPGDMTDKPLHAGLYRLYANLAEGHPLPEGDSRTSITGWGIMLS